MTQRGERGVRVADFNYRKASLELGMLKGNAFVITLRLVVLESLLLICPLTLSQQCPCRLDRDSRSRDDHHQD